MADWRRSVLQNAARKRQFYLRGRVSAPDKHALRLVSEDYLEFARKLPAECFRRYRASHPVHNQLGASLDCGRCWSFPRATQTPVRALAGLEAKGHLSIGKSGIARVGRTIGWKCPVRPSPVESKVAVRDVLLRITGIRPHRVLRVAIFVVCYHLKLGCLPA